MKRTKTVMTRNKESNIIASMFLPAAVVMIFTQLVGVVANIIDGVVTSRFIGEDAYSAVSLLGPMVQIILLFATFVSVGCQIVCSEKIGAGRRDEANAVFTFAIGAGVIVSVCFVLLSLFVPGILISLCGVSASDRPELFAYCLEYLRGYLIGIPAVVMIQVVSPFLVMDNDKRLVSLSAIVLCAVDIVGDLLNAIVIRGGIFGMGLATSIAMWLQLLILTLHFVGKGHYLGFRILALSGKELLSIAKNGALTFLRELATIVRDIFTNRINLLVTVTVAAIAAKGIQNDLNMLMFCIGIGIGKTLVSMTGIYYGANDKAGLQRVFAYAMKVSVVMAGIVGIVLFVAAPYITMIYTSDPEVTKVAVFGIRCMAIGLIPDTVSVAYQDYLQGIQNRLMLNFLCFTERFFIPVVVAWILGMRFGAWGIMASIAVSKFVLIILIFVLLTIVNRGIPRRVADYMLLRADFGGREEDNMVGSLRTLEDVTRESESLMEFCLAHGLSRRNANLLSLFIEEMGVNIVRHGKPRNRGGICMDYRLQISGDRVVISLRDFCEAFDPQKYYEVHKAENPTADIGIRMIMRLAEDIRYIYAFNSNCVMLCLPLADGAKHEASEQGVLE